AESVGRLWGALVVCHDREVEKEPTDICVQRLTRPLVIKDCVCREGLATSAGRKEGVTSRPTQRGCSGKTAVWCSPCRVMPAGRHRRR
ncbi:unnamed protein product, partial [Ectocarpus sp. 12 AP-2014]